MSQREGDAATLAQLYSTFFRVGLFTFGGGYAMLPMLEREMVARRGWATRDDLLDYFAIGQCTPGIIALNVATLVGYMRRRLAGAVCASLGLLTPSVVIIIAIASLLQNFAHMPAVVHAFAGIRVAVCALIAASVFNLFKSNVLQKPESGAARGAAAFAGRNALPLALCAGAFCAVALAGASPVLVVIGAAAAGLLLYGRKKGGAE